MCSADSSSISALSPPEPMSTPAEVRFDLDHLVGQGTDATQRRHQLLVLLGLLGDPAHPDPRLHVTDRLRQRLDAVHEVLAELLAQLVEPRDRVAVGRLGRVAEQVEQAALDVLGHHVLPPAGLGVHELPVQADHVGEQPLGEPVLAHHPGGQPQPLGGQLEVPVALDGQQAVALHPGDRLGDGRTALVQPLGDPRAQRHDALLDQLVDGPEVHLGGVDQIAHRPILSSWGDAPVPPCWQSDRR